MPESIGLGALRTNWFARNVSSTCNSFGSALWGLTKDIKPVVDANCHNEAIEFEYHRSPIQFPPILYQGAGSDLPDWKDQPILFGCPLELRPGGELPPVLEYLLEYLQHYDDDSDHFSVSQEHRNCNSY